MMNECWRLEASGSLEVRWGFAGLAWTDITHFLKVKRIAIQLEENLAPSIYRSSKKKKKSTHTLKAESIKRCPSIFSRATNHFLCLFSLFERESVRGFFSTGTGDHTCDAKWSLLSSTWTTAALLVFLPRTSPSLTRGVSPPLMHSELSSAASRHKCNDGCCQGL